MPDRRKNLLRIFGALLVAAAVLLWWRTRSVVRDEQALARGEEVYASHDCTDCHLATHVLKQKKQQKSDGLIRVRRDTAVLLKFLETDRRHLTWPMISEQDRRDLLEYLKSQLR